MSSEYSLAHFRNARKQSEEMRGKLLDIRIKNYAEETRKVYMRIPMHISAQSFFYTFSVYSAVSWRFGALKIAIME